MRKQSRITIWVSSLLFLALSGMAAMVIFQFHEPVNRDELNSTHLFLINSINKKWDNYFAQVEVDRIPLVSYKELEAVLNTPEKELLHKIIPLSLVESEIVDIEKQVDFNLFKIPEVVLPENPWRKSISPQYVSAGEHQVFESMMKEMESSIGRRLYICSGYRSLGRQAFLIMQYFSLHESRSLTDMEELIAYPGESEHNSVTSPAVDLCNRFGFLHETGPTRLMYRWMDRYAHRYGYFLTYPRNNEKGKMFEPWHWRYDPRKHSE